MDRWPSNHRERRSTSLTIRATQSKALMRCHFTPVRMAFMKKTASEKRGGGCGETATLPHACWECKSVQSLCQDSPSTAASEALSGLQPQQLLLPGRTAREHREGPALRQVGDPAGSSAPNGSNATSTRSPFPSIRGREAFRPPPRAPRFPRIRGREDFRAHARLALPTFFMSM